MAASKKSYATRLAKLNLRDNNILEIDIQSDSLIERRDMEDLIEGAKNIGNGKKLKNLILVGKGTITDVNSRRLSASIYGSRYKTADAFVIQGPTQQLIMNMYLKIQKPIVPTKLFTSKNEAIAWLNQAKIMA